MHPDWATGIMFSRYFMPFMGGRRKQEAPIQENSTITTSKRVVIESMIYMQCFSEVSHIHDVNRQFIAPSLPSSS